MISFHHKNNKLDFRQLKSQWREEENFAFQGWDFSHIDGRWESEKLPWDYKEIVLSYLEPTYILLDLGTGGGEFLLSLNHPYSHTYVTEAYVPNVGLCKDRLKPLGITVAQTFDDDMIPFKENSFDLIINRHESFDFKEVSRVLKSGGYFITQQVGGQNDIDLSKRLIKDFKPKFPNHSLENCVKKLKDLDFEIHKADEAFTPIKFFDVGALVYFAKIIEWEFPGFSVEESFGSLCDCQKELEENGFVLGTEHRFLIVARKL